MTGLKTRTALDEPLLVYAELSEAQQRTVRRRIAAGTVHRIRAGLATTQEPEVWPSLIAREWPRVLAGLFPGAVIGYRSAFAGGMPVHGAIHLNYSYARTFELPGLKVVLVKGPGPAEGDVAVSDSQLYFPSYPRLLLENLSFSHSVVRKEASRAEVQERLATLCDSRGEQHLQDLLEQARALAPSLGLERQCKVLAGLVDGVLATCRAQTAPAESGKSRAAVLPVDRNRLALFETFAARLRSLPPAQLADPAQSPGARRNFAFLESYFSNFIEGTEFEVQEARGFVLDGQPLGRRHQDSHDLIGIFRQAFEPGWARQTLASGQPVLEQLRARHADQMKERPEVGPGHFKERANRAGNTVFVLPREVRGTLLEGARLLPSVPAGMPRALFSMFLVAEVHPFADGNGRLARLVMNAQLSAEGACRVIVPTLHRGEYLDGLRVLTREGDCEPLIAAMATIARWTAAFDYEDLDAAIASMQACNAFEDSRMQYKLLFPDEVASARARVL